MSARAADAARCESAERLRRNLVAFPAMARGYSFSCTGLVLLALASAPSVLGILLALSSTVGLLRVPRRRLLVEQMVVATAAVGLSHGLLATIAVGLPWLGGLLIVLRRRPEVATQRLIGFDRCHLLLTTPIRPCLTHHFLELEAPVDRRLLTTALGWLIRDVPRLRSFVRETPLGTARFVAPALWVEPETLIEWNDTPVDLVAAGWFERPLDLGRAPPVRVLHAPLPGGGCRLGLTLHHSIADGTGAMILLDGLLRRIDRLRGFEIELPDMLSDGPRVGRLAVRLLLKLGWRSGWRVFWRLLRLSAQSSTGVRSASLVEDHTPRPAHSEVRAVDVPIALWRRVLACAASSGRTPNQLLLAVSLRAADAVRRARGLDDRAFRLLLPSDLRNLFDLPRSLPNYLGTVRLEIRPHELRRTSLSALPGTIAERIRVGRAPEEQLRFPLQVGVIGLLPPAIGRWVLRRYDQDPGKNPFSFLWSHIRVPLTFYRPHGSASPRLWCASAQGRQPSFGIVVTTLGERTVVLLQYLHPYVGHETVRVFAEALLVELDALLWEFSRRETGT